jgi:chemotaxis signal transduction protein
MSETPARVHDRAAVLRHAFDRAFADAQRFDTAAAENLLAIRVGAERCALRLSEITGLFSDRGVTRVPGGAAALIGLAGFRGTLLPVYSLQALLGLGAAKLARWQVVAAAAPVVFAFEQFDGQLRATPDNILAAEARATLGGCAKEFVRIGDFAGPILHVPSVLELVDRPGDRSARVKNLTEKER